MLDLPVVVLCGGLGTRLSPIVADRPKSLAAWGDRPFLAVQLELLRDRGARRFVLCVGHMAEQIEAAFGDGAALGVRIDYSRDGEKLLGTAGALKRAERFFEPAAVVVNGDTYLDLDLARLVRVHSSAQARGAVATLTLAHVPDTSRFGAVELRGNRVVGFREKSVPGGGWVNAGAYVIERELLKRIPADEVVSLERDVFPAALRDGVRLAAVAHEEPFADIGTPEDYRAFVWRAGKRSMSREAVFLDRDGTLIEEVHYLAAPEQVRLIPGAADAVRRLNAAGVLVIVVTNQAGVARGYFPESRVGAVHAHLSTLLAERGARIDAYFHCPHHPTDGVGAYRVACECRKPKPGLLLTAARELGIDLSRSWMIGDKLCDAEAGEAAGCRTILVRTGHGRELPYGTGVHDIVAAIELWASFRGRQTTT